MGRVALQSHPESATDAVQGAAVLVDDRPRAVDEQSPLLIREGISITPLDLAPGHRGGTVDTTDVRPDVGGAAALTAGSAPGLTAGSAAGVTAGSAPGDDLGHRSRRLPPSWGRRYRRRLVVTDVLAIACAALGVHQIQVAQLSAVANDPGHLPFMAATAFLSVLWFAVLTWSGTRDLKIIGEGATEFKRVLQATFGMFGAVAIGSYLFRLDLPRGYLLVMMPVGLAVLLLTRAYWWFWLRRRRRSGDFMSAVLAVGDRQTVHELLRDLGHAPQAGYRVVGVCVCDPDPRTTRPDGSQDYGRIDGVPILGSVDDVIDVVRDIDADAVAVTATNTFGPTAVRRLSWELQDTDAELVLAPALTNVAGPRLHTQPVAGLPLIHVDRPTYRGANRILKKSFDVVGSLTLLLLLSVPLLAIAAAIKLTSRGPVFFHQDRIGINGRTFKMIKFRSMVIDAEAQLAKLREQAERGAGNKVLFKMKDDPRVTKVGKFIRRFSLDEIPQLFNVLRGDMSLVGPRPPLAREVALYGDEARRRLLVKPGMTGLWQVSGRSDLSWDDSVRLDLYYVENWSLTSDLAILARTAKAVVASKGAY